jgi:hypothetical protein
VNDDAVYRRYRRMIVKPSLRKNATQKGFYGSYFFCAALAAISFACSLHFVRETGAPWWVSLIGMAEGRIVLPFLFIWGDAVAARGFWNKRNLSGLLFVVPINLSARFLAAWLIPQEHYPFEFEAGFFLAWAATAFLLLPLLFGGQKAKFTPPA